MSENRRRFFQKMASVGAGIAIGSKSAEAQQRAALRPNAQGATNVPFAAPDLDRLPFRIVNGAKEFHLVAEVVETEFLPGRKVHAWGYNGSVPGPTIEINEGDRVRVVFHNNLPEMTTVHWHGLEIPMDMDGVPGLGQDPVMPGGMYTYEFTVDQHGTFFYHSHFAMQEMMGMIGFFVVHPKVPVQPRVDRDFGLILQEWALLPNNTVPNTLSMEFNWLTLNGKAGPATTPMLAKKGERIRIRFVNLGMDHHPMHMHGHQFYVTGTEGGRIPESGWYPGNTVLVGVGQSRDVEFVAKYEGDWMIHCHLPHHMMNQMVSMVGPMSHGGSIQTGASMETGMGMLDKGHALSEEFGPSLGRGLGMAADNHRPTSAMVGAAQSTPAAGTEHDQHQHHAGAAPDAENTPGFPQDMWMPTPNDMPYATKPENYKLRQGWTGAMMGMMTLIRVLPPKLYDEIMAMKQRASENAEDAQ